MLRPNTFHILVLGFLALAALIASVWTVYSLDPTANPANIVIFYAASAVFVLTLTALILFSFRQRFGVRERVQRHLWISVRQGTWAAVLYVAALILQANGLFSWLNSAFLVIAMTFLEVYFLYNERQSGTN